MFSTWVSWGKLKSISQVFDIYQHFGVFEGKDYVSVLSTVPGVNHTAWYMVYLKNELMLS